MVNRHGRHKSTIYSAVSPGKKQKEDIFFGFVDVTYNSHQRSISGDFCGNDDNDNNNNNRRTRPITLPCVQGNNIIDRRYHLPVYPTFYKEC